MRRLLLPTLMVAAVLALPGMAQAQRGGRGGGGAHVGGAHVGGAHVGGAHVSGAHVGAVNHNNFNRNGFIFVGWPGYGYLGGYYGGYYPGFYGSSYAGYSSYYSPTYYSPTYYVMPSYPAIPPDYGMEGKGPTLPSNRAQIQVVLPDPEATLLFDGTKTSSVGKVRLFDPPELEPGVTYSYKVTATWVEGGKPVTDVRKVSIKGGQGTLVDFTRPAPPELVPLPKPDKE
jgi:uncharacterized protein (TIGR03000 family)